MSTKDNVIRRLVIVESPAKARTIAAYLGDGFVVESSVGHIRDLPERASEIPKSQREKYGALGVAIDEGFEPYYVLNPSKKQIVAELRRKLKEADELLLATDEDREGEAIAYHLVETLKPKVPVRRMVFHEITAAAIRRALDEPRDIDHCLVDAQETRRILDRLYGYEVSPVLWKKVTRGLSAGRVQSVATRLVVERERERMRFVAAGYWDLTGVFAPGDFDARISSVDGRRIAQGRDFGPDGQPRGDVLVLNEGLANELAQALQEKLFSVREVREAPYSKRPAAPFRTSTLQQEASRKLNFTAQRTMRVAQRLYEGGYITYMRTDSVTLSDVALAAARKEAAARYGPETVPDRPRTYSRPVANAQEAHEAIRPAGDHFRAPEELKELTSEEWKLYDLVWRRTVSSQMKDAAGQTTRVRLGTDADGRDVEFRASGLVVTFPGFLLAYESGRDEQSEAEEERRLPRLREGERLQATSIRVAEHETTAPPRFTEASLVRALEERGIGRPSTYASILTTIQDRGYVFKKGTALVPTFTAFAVTQLLEAHFDRLVDYEFTARMENDLDDIAAGTERRVDWLTRFYKGNGGPGLHALVTDRLDEIDAREVNRIEIPGSDVVVRVGRYGPYLERDGDRASLPPDLPPDELTPARIEELLATTSSERRLGFDAETGNEIVVKVGRYGPFVAELLPEDASDKPRTASLFASMSPETVTLEDAVRLLGLPRVLQAPDGEEVVVANGRYGAFVRKGSETRSLDSEEQIFSITVEEALRLLAEPKQRRRRGSPAQPLKELGEDPTNGKRVVVKDGRYGPYVTDGETNASLEDSDDPESMTLERAVELLAEKRAKGPVAKRRRRTRRR